MCNLGDLKEIYFDFNWNKLTKNFNFILELKFQNGVVAVWVSKSFNAEQVGFESFFTSNFDWKTFIDFLPPNLLHFFFQMTSIMLRTKDFSRWEKLHNLNFKQIPKRFSCFRLRVQRRLKRKTQSTSLNQQTIYFSNKIFFLIRVFLKNCFLFSPAFQYHAIHPSQIMIMMQRVLNWIFRFLRYKITTTSTAAPQWTTLIATALSTAWITTQITDRTHYAPSRKYAGWTSFQCHWWWLMWLATFTGLISCERMLLRCADSTWRRRVWYTWMIWQF